MKLTLIILFVFACTLEAQAARVNVTIFYDSLSSTSKQYITAQVYPIFKHLANDILLDLVPFGLANYTYENGKWNFTCQHGPEECLGNKYQACALANRGNHRFVDCAMSSHNPASTEILELCCHRSGILWADLDDCYNSGEGDIFLAQYGNRKNSLNPPLESVPTTLFNSVYNETLNAEAITNFGKVVCTFFDVEPPFCRHFGKD